MWGEGGKGNVAVIRVYLLQGVNRWICTWLDESMILQDCSHRHWFWWTAEIHALWLWRKHG